MEIPTKKKEGEEKDKFEDLSKHKFFNERKYYLHKNRWVCTSTPNNPLSHDVWNFYNPKDKIRKDEVIHHIDLNPSDDRIENLEKMSIGNHHALHSVGEMNSQWKGGLKSDLKKYSNKYSKENYVRKTLFSENDGVEGFCYNDYLIYNTKTNNIIISHSWGSYRKRKKYGNIKNKIEI